MVIGYNLGSGTVPLISGNPWSGHTNVPEGQLVIRADANNSGAIYVYLSGANFFSGQLFTPVGSGGMTLTSGSLNAAGLNDGMVLYPKDSYSVPRYAIPLTGPNSGIYTLSVGCDAVCSGQAKVWWEAF